MARPRFNQTLTVDAATKAAWCREIRALPEGGVYEMTLDPRRWTDDELRSTDANRWYFKCVVTPLALYLMDQEVELGTMERAKDYAHYEVIVPEILGYDEIPLPNGRTVKVPKPTHTMSVDEFRDFSNRAEVFVWSYIGEVEDMTDAPALGARR